MHNNKYIPSNDIAILIVYKIIKKNTLESNFSNNYLIKRLFAKLKDLKKFRYTPYFTAVYRFVWIVSVGIFLLYSDQLFLTFYPCIGHDKTS